ncbi:MAG: hypothetical protein JXM69_16790 [Anaerolineae bacterium]|nr:hypothetical protein [Anaerolineae bacterium]
MTETSQADFSQEVLERLQRLRASVLTFRHEIAPLPADQQSDARNEQFNHLRLEAKAILKEQDFDKKVPKAITAELVASHSQRMIPRLFAIVILGVILALVGLGINSIVLDEFVINILACLISIGGMFLIIGAFGVLGMTNWRQPRRLTNYGDLYQYCNALLYEISHALNMTIPDLADRPADHIPEISSVIELMLDALHKQAADWQQKLRTLEEQRLSLGMNVPMELNINIDFVQRELNRVRQEINRLQGQMEMPAAINQPDVTST